MKKTPWTRGKRKPKNHLRPSARNQGGGPCDATRCPHTGNGHCQDVLCANYFLSCPVHGEG
jgi:hypothetical protein